jgi:hypothetical protein
MMSDMESIDVLKKQLAKLERTVRWLKRCFICVAISGLAVVAGGAVEQEDNSINIKDQANVLRVSMGFNKVNVSAGLEVYSEKGLPRILVGETNQGVPIIMFYSADGTKVVRTIGPNGPNL